MTATHNLIRVHSMFQLFFHSSDTAFNRNIPWNNRMWYQNINGKRSTKCSKKERKKSLIIIIGCRMSDVIHFNLCIMAMERVRSFIVIQRFMKQFFFFIVFFFLWKMNIGYISIILLYFQLSHGSSLSYHLLRFSIVILITVHSLNIFEITNYRL